MTAIKKPPFQKWVPVSAALGIITFFVYAYYSAGFAELIPTIETINLRLYLLAFVLVALDVLFTSLGWLSLLRTLHIRITVRRAYVLSWVGFFVDAMIPSGWSGDLFKAYLITKDGSATGSRSGAAAVVQRVIVMSVALGGILVGMILLFFNYHVEMRILFPLSIVAIVFAVSIIIAIAIIVKPRATRGLVQLSSRLVHLIQRKPWDKEKFESSWGETLNGFQDSLKALTTEKSVLFRPVVLATMAWASEILALMVVFNAIGYSITADRVIIVYSIGSALESQTAAFAGFAQIITSALYEILGIAPVISVAATLMIGLAGFWFKLFVSYLSFSCVVMSKGLCAIWTRRRENKQVDIEPTAGQGCIR